jgi:ubiquinol-cytochrome c reductase cytochrome c subunit
MVRARTLVYLVAAAAVALTACGPYESVPDRPFRPPAEPVTGPDAGNELYSRDCGWCHGGRAQGTSRGPDLISGTNGRAFTHFMLTTGRMPIDHPRQLMTRREPVYETSEIDAIVEYVASFGAPGPEIPELDLETGDLGLGSALYEENCAACHSTTGVGGALTEGSADDISGVVGRDPGFIAPTLRNSSPTEVAESILVGPGTMPVFATFSDDELNSLVRYVTYLQDPADEGGAPIGRIGPVAEGAVGWIIGLGALVLLLRWIGTRARRQ